MVWMWVLIGCLGFVSAIVLLYASINLVDQTERGLIERWGKFRRFAEPGLHILIPFVETMRKVDITEQMVDAENQEIITKDKLNATVDAQIYFKVRENEEGIKSCQYNVYNYNRQIVALTRTTLRNVIGTMTLAEVNSERDRINHELQKTLDKEADDWGIDVIRAELKEVDPPADVQKTMNEVVKAENKKEASRDYALAREIEAEGVAKARIKKADGDRKSRILEAEGIAKSIELESNAKGKAIKVVNESANKYFKDNAMKLKRLETIENTFKNTEKMIIPEGSDIINMIGDIGGFIPLKINKE